MLETLVKELKLAAQGAASGLVQQAAVDRGAKWIEALKREFPIVHELIQKVLYKTPEEVLDTLTNFNPNIREYSRNPAALEYVKQLQLRLRGNKRQ